MTTPDYGPYYPCTIDECPRCGGTGMVSFRIVDGRLKTYHK